MIPVTCVVIFVLLIAYSKITGKSPIPYFRRIQEAEEEQLK